LCGIINNSGIGNWDIGTRQSSLPVLQILLTRTLMV